MQEEEFTFQSKADGTQIAGVKWKPASPPKAVVQISHGLAEHCRRYRRLAEALCNAGYAAYAHDHRGHGASIAPDTTPGDFGAGGWPGLVDDLTMMTDEIGRDYPKTPIILLGHSMGSFAAQNYLLDHGERLSACVLSGSSDMPSLAQAAMAGEDLSFAAFNAAFEPVRTTFDWLSRDEAEVDAYIADPLCGFDAPPETSMGMMTPAMRIAEPKAFSTLRQDFPVLIISGRADPLCRGGALLETLASRLTESGLSDVGLQLYDDARHEIFNETNRDEATADLIAWLDRVVG